MNWDEWKKTWRQALQLFLTLALAIAFYFFLLRFYSIKKNIGTVMNILMPFIYGGVMAYLLKTPCNFFDKFWEAFLPEKLKKHKNGISVLTVLILVFLILYTLLRTVIPQVVSSISVLAGMAPRQVTRFFDWVSSYLNSEGVVQNYVRPITEDLSTKMADWANTDLLPYLQNIVTNTLNSLVGIVSNLGIGFIVCVYALCARKKFARQGKAVVYSILKPKYADAFMNELEFADKTFDGFLSGKINRRTDLLRILPDHDRHQRIFQWNPDQSDHRSHEYHPIFWTIYRCDTGDTVDLNVRPDWCSDLPDIHHYPAAVRWKCTGTKASGGKCRLIRILGTVRHHRIWRILWICGRIDRRSGLCGDL